MQITLNGERVKISANLNITNLLAKYELSENKVAIELNREIIPISDYHHTILQENDQVEIVEFVGGG
ncbi:MAG: sulfur carrier protein ThiS [Alphaproteobacteria bacterium]|jgi:sulfur carrier protein|nr:sulfur carrier protein ThiS [Alphaproteobacteria bacterium]MBT5828017.1 sulfur carrier protein ThiS [Alphaproteobacteria bacterium]